MNDLTQALVSQGYYVFDCVNATIPHPEIRDIKASEISIHRKWAEKGATGPYDLIYPGPSYETALCALSFLSGYQHDNRPKSATIPVETTERGILQHIFTPTAIPNAMFEGRQVLLEENEEQYLNSKHYGPGLIAELKKALLPERLAHLADEAVAHLEWILKTNTIREPGEDGGNILVFTYWWIPTLAAWRIKSQNGEVLERRYMSNETLHGIRFLAKQVDKNTEQHKYELTVHGKLNFTDLFI